ncbi:MAG: SgcJ/EcaC family oxidoreductase [Spirosomataceae bacterium]
MKKILIVSAIIATIFAFQNNVVGQVNDLKKVKMVTTEKSAIEKVLFSYRDALNASDVSKVLTLYTSDGVFMPSNAPSAVGQEQVRGSYEFVFKTIQLNIEFFIDEIVVNGDYAFARTTSKGTTLIHANGQTVPEENRELFVLQKLNGEWKISRYMFNKMK